MKAVILILNFTNVVGRWFVQLDDDTAHRHKEKSRSTHRVESTTDALVSCKKNFLRPNDERRDVGIGIFRVTLRTMFEFNIRFLAHVG